MSNFSAWFEKENGDYWMAEFDDDFLITAAWYNGKRVKLTARRELVLYHAFKGRVDLKALRRQHRILTRNQ